MHIEPHQFRRLANKSQNDLIAEFSALRAAQNAHGQPDGIDPTKYSSRNSVVGPSNSVPASNQITARSSVYVPEPASPVRNRPVQQVSNHVTRHISTKGSFSVPFRDGRSPKLQQHASTELLSMPISESRLLDQGSGLSNSHNTAKSHPQDQSLCTRCASRVVQPNKPVKPEVSTKLDRSPDGNSTALDPPTGLKTSYWPSPCAGGSCEFKKLPPKSRVQFSGHKTRAPTSPPKPQSLAPKLHHLQPPSPFLPDLGEMRVSMNRSSVSGGLFSSWAADDDSGDEADPAPTPTSPLSPSDVNHTTKPKARNRPLQKGVHNGKNTSLYTAPMKPPPAGPLPRVPETPPLPKQERADASKGEPKPLLDDSPSAEESTDSALEDDTKRFVHGTNKALPRRRPSNKSVRFQTSEVHIPEEKTNSQASDSSLDRVQQTLDDLRNNISRLEVDFTQQSADEMDQVRPKTAGSKDIPRSNHPLTQATSAPRPLSRDEQNGSHPPRPNKKQRSGSATSKRPSIIPELPQLPPTIFDPQEPKLRDDGTHERTFSNGSATIPPAAALPAMVEV